MMTRHPVTRLTLVALAVLTPGIVPCLALAQEDPRIQLLGGVTLLETSDIVDDAGTGWAVGGVWNITDAFGVELQANRFEQAQTVTFLEVNARFLTLLIGPTLTWRQGPVHPFTRLLVGTTQLDLAIASAHPLPSSGDSQETASTLLVGGGVIIPLAQRLSIRLAYDYRRVFATERFYQHGVTASALYGFGGRHRRSSH